MDAASDHLLLPAGSRLAHYRLGEVLGSGAMGTVYQAHDLGLERGVAVKVLHREIAQDPRMVERFFREARAAAHVNHPNLAHVYYVGHEGPHSFFAMEYVPGQNLEQAVVEHGPFTLAAAVAVLAQAAQGLQAAHEAGLVHRDVKPSNLIRRPDGVLKVTDFGLARSVQGEVELSGAGAVTGTPTYMSPEQVRGETADARTDIYALGLTAFYLLAGHAPFSGPTLGRVLSDQLTAPLPALTALQPGLPARIDEVLGRLCSKDRAHRPADMRGVVTLLETLRPRRVSRAPLAARASAYVLDWLLTVVAWAALLFLLGVILDEPGRPSSTWPKLLFCVLWAVGQLGMESWRGASLGKHLLQLAVSRPDGLPARRGALVLRFFVRSPEWILGIVPLGAGWTFGWMEAASAIAVGAGALCFLLNRGRTLSDLASETTVIYRHPARA